MYSKNHPADHLSLQENMIFHLTKHESPSIKRYFVSSLIEIGEVVLKTKMKTWKLYVNNNRQRDKFQSGKLTRALSSGELI